MESKIKKPEIVTKRIIKAIGNKQSVLILGEWNNTLIQSIKENENIISTGNCLEKNLYSENSFTRILADYNSIVSIDVESFYLEARNLLLPTGILIVSAESEKSIFDNISELFFKKQQANTKDGIKPKILQDQIHDHNFLIDGYYGYPGNHILMMAQIINKEVSTLFNTEEQKTLKI